MKNVNHINIIIHGPECTVKFTQKEINKLFGNNNKYIGNLKIPNAKDFKGLLKYLGYSFSLTGKLAKSRFIGIKEKISRFFNNTKALPPGKGNEHSEDHNYISSKTSRSWDLNGWGLKPEDVSKNTSIQHTKHEEQQKNEQDIDER